jgi:hypothetical protein
LYSSQIFTAWAAVSAQPTWYFLADPNSLKLLAERLKIQNLADIGFSVDTGGIFVGGTFWWSSQTVYPKRGSL